MGAPLYSLYDSPSPDLAHLPALSACQYHMTVDDQVESAFTIAGIRGDDVRLAKDRGV
jgi:hypothetical protein